MAHFFVLLPLLIIVSLVLNHAYKKDPQNLYAKHFRNFSVLWTSCTLIGASSVALISFFFVQVAYKDYSLLSTAFSLPFHYFAIAALVGLPFALYNKFGFLSKLIIGIMVFLGIFIGSILFVKAKNLFGDLGPLQGFYEAAFKNLKEIRVFAVLGVLIPLALFFFVEAIRATSKVFRMRSMIMGMGTLIIGVAGGTHVFLGPVKIGFDGLLMSYIEYGVPLGFLIIFGGLLYGKESTSEQPVVL